LLQTILRGPTFVNRIKLIIYNSYCSFTMSISLRPPPRAHRVRQERSGTSYKHQELSIKLLGGSYDTVMTMGLSSSVMQGICLYFYLSPPHSLPIQSPTHTPTSPTHSPIHSPTHSPTGPTHSPIHPLTHPLVPPTHQITHSVTHSLCHWSHSLTNSLTHSLTHSLCHWSHSLTNSLTH